MSLPGLFVVGTDTGVGKTLVASRIAGSWRMAGRRVGVLKPVASGAALVNGSWVSDDTLQLVEALGGGVPLERVTPLVFREPLAPPVAARRQGTPLAFEDLIESVAKALSWWEDRADLMVVEGVGGLLCPIAEGATVADLAVALDLPLVIVAHRGLGTLNHSLLTVEAARSRGLRVAGLILNGARASVDPIAEATNADELALRLRDVAILANWPHLDEFPHSSVAPEADDWYDLVRPPRGGRFASPRSAESPT